MTIKKTSFFFTFFPVLLLSVVAFSQTKEQLQQQKKKLQKDIEYKSRILKQTRKNKQLSSIQLIMLGKKINSRKKLISNIQLQIRLLNEKIKTNRDLITSLQKDLEELKRDYARMIYYAYRNRNSYDKLLFFFSSEDFNQAYKRLKYLQQYALYRKKQAEMIVKTKKILSQKVKELLLARNEKEKLLGIEHSEKQKLSIEIKEQQNTLLSLKKKEKQLKNEINKNLIKAKKLQQAIEKIIEEELKAKGKNYYALTPEAKKLSKSFNNNKGKLPWPVEKGVITEYFGEHPHPVLKQVIVKNNGINISTTEGSEARAVFEGEVSRVLILPGSGKAVMIRHGEYISIYSNLESSYVKRGQKVSTKQKIGKILTDPVNGKTQLHFELWKSKHILNPSPWLYRTH